MKTSYKHAFLDNKAFNSLEKARFCEVVMGNGMCKDTDISVYNYISNILTLHILLCSIINNELVPTTVSIILSVFLKKAHFLLWLIFSRTEAFASHFCDNIRNFEEILARIRVNAKNTEISEKISNLALLLEVTNNHFWLRKWRNRLRVRVTTKASYINKKSRNQKIAVTEPVQLGYALFLSDKCSFFNLKAT